MSRVLNRGRPFLANLPSNDPCRATRDLLRKSTQKFFLPFVQTRQSSADLASYRFRENLSNVLVPSIIDNSTKPSRSTNLPSSSGVCAGGGNSAAAKGSFLCAAQLNGEVGTSRIFEDLFHVILAGFDVVHVNVENKDGCSMAVSVQDPCHFCGFLVLAHTRPFLGWQPSYIQMPKTAIATELNPSHPRNGISEESYSRFQLRTHDILPFAKENEGEVLLPKTFMVPFSTHVEGASTADRSNFLLSHFNLRLRFVDALCTDPAARDTFGVPGNRLDRPPEAVVKALTDRETVKLFVGLRRLGVRPELITAETLLAATEQKAAWAQALSTM